MKFHTLSAALALAMLSQAFARQADAQDAQSKARAFVEPLDLMNPHAGTEACSGDAPKTSGHAVSLNLKITYSDHTIYNPSTGTNDHVHLRTYNDCLVGPTIRMKPGERFLLNVENDLPANDPSCPATLTDHNDPNCFNSGNIHTHGLHVSPTGNSDNVLLSIPPGTTFPYQYDLLDNHPAGTFWYHSHRHGSTALSVSSGMVGALIVEGSRRIQDKQKNGIADIDTILHDRQHRKLTDRVLVLEQIAYGCFANGDTSGFPEQDSTGTWTCGSNDIGVVENYKTQFGFETVPGSNPPIRGSVWPTSERFTEINGKVMPTMTVKSGQIERWRFIDGGVRDTTNVQIVKTKPAAVANAALAGTPIAVPNSRQALKQFVSQVCDTTQVVKQYEIALDGLTRREIHAKDLNVMQPGYRSDVLMVFPDRGIYCVLDTEKNPAATIIGAGHRLQSSDNNLLAIVDARTGTTVTGDPLTYIEGQLIAANPDLPNAVKQEIRQADIHEYSPHPDLNTATIAGRPFVDFNFLLFSSTLTVPASPPPVNAVLLGQAAIADSAASAHALVVDTPATIPTLPNVATYDPAVVNYTAQLGNTDEWSITSSGATHVFHIHVNPFQIMDIRNGGNSIIDASGNCNDGGDPQYCDLFDKTQNRFGAYRDTIFIKQGYQIVMRTTYQTYIGQFVIHCHILDHEDQGMMQNIVICSPGGPCPIVNEPAPLSAHMHMH